MQPEIINYVKFGVLSPEQIKRLSVAKLTVPDTYTEDGYPIDGGLLDQRLGVIDPGLVCKTCGGRAKICPGHFGHIELVRPVVHSDFAKIIYLLLQAKCQSCNRIMLNEEQTEEAKEKIRVFVEGNDEDNQENFEGNSLLKKLRNIKKCPHCGAPQQKVKFEAPTYFYIGDKRLKPDEIRDMLAKISDDDLRLLNIDPKSSRPEWLILTSLLVPPVNVRPSITLESGERSEDDLTHKLVDVMRINQRLEQNINAGAPQIIIDDLWELLQYNVTTYFNNETPGIPPARHRSGRALKTLAQRLKGKEGRFRYNLSGKRVNYSARTVISVDPYLDIDEVGLPFEIASKLTLPFYVTKWNFDKAKELLARKEYPTVVNVITKDKKRRRIVDTNRDEVLKELQVGDILERQVTDGDIVLFNRQPSLHRISIMAHRVKVLPGKTMRLNYCATFPYNADFDGDEMNLHVPQTLEALAEAKYLMQVKDQVFSPRDGGAIISNSEDGITGAFLLTDDNTKLTKEEAINLLANVGVYELPHPDRNGLYSGKDVFSMLLPKDFDFEYKKGNNTVKIKNGKIVEGTMTKDVYGQKGKMIEKLYVTYGPDFLREFITKSARMTYAYLTMWGITIGVKDYMLSQKLAEEKEKILSDAFSKTNKYIEEYKAGTLKNMVGYTRKQSLENYIIAELDRAREQAGQEVVKNSDPKSHSIVMVRAGARGTIMNLVQMTAFLGQQATLKGGRIKRGYASNRVLPTIKPNDMTPTAKGFIVSSYYSGLSPEELFMHAIGSRISLVYKAMLTARSGYLQRRLINALQDYYVNKDESVRDIHGNIIETLYGGDGVDPIKVRFTDYLEKKELQAAHGEPVGVVAAQSIGEPSTQMVLRSFHFAGITSTIATSGLPRMVELLDAKKKPSAPLTYVYFDKSINKNFDKVEKIANSINEVKVSDVARRITDNFSKGIVIVRLDTQVLEANGMKPGFVSEKIAKQLKLDAKVVNGRSIVIKTHTKNHKAIRNILLQVKSLTINGLHGVGKVFIQNDSTTGEFYLITTDSNLQELLNVEGVDANRIYTNDIFEIYRVFGIEAARNALARELKKILAEQGFTVNDRHLLVVADAMTADGTLRNVGRHGLSGSKGSVFARAAYEETVKHITNAAAFGEIDQMKGVTENILVGKQIQLGTGIVKLAIKKEDLAKITDKAKPEK
ncbi:MAG: DNA-directed RNA polymerase subunit A' [Candidatus Micrarchaeia archaeon]